MNKRMGLNTNLTQSKKIEEWNNQLSDVLIPIDILSSVFILHGIIGNSTVLYVCK